MTTPGFKLKLQRAIEHAYAVDVETGAWVKTKPWRFICEPDPEPPPHAVPDGFIAMRTRLGGFDPAPERLSVLIGDCLFNLRSALDQLAFALAQKHTPAMTDRQRQQSMFPIYSTIEKFKNKKRDQIGCIEPAARNIIESLQPYNGKGGYLTHPLWQIHELNRIDKHRTLRLCTPDFASWGSGIGISSDVGIFGIRKISQMRVQTMNVESRAYTDTDCFSWNFSAPENGAVIVRWAGRPKDPDHEMGLRLDFSLEPTIEDPDLGMKLEPIVPLLQRLCNFVGKGVIVPLSKFL